MNRVLARHAISCLTSDKPIVSYRSFCAAQRRFLRVALCIVAILIHGCGAATRELEQVNAQQAVTETKVKAALVDEQSVDAASIQVSLEGGSIVLSGFVDTQQESDTAERLARQSTQGLPVINSLEIR